MSTQSALLKVMTDAARKAARGLNRDFGELAELQVAKKAPADFVSAADLKAEQTIFEALAKARPGYGFLGEERGMIEGTDKTHTWIVDPLDGTTNFLHAIPHFAINIALQREGAIVAAVTYNPVTNELFWAEKGKGAFVNDKRLRVAARTRMDEAVLATGIPFLGHGQHAHLPEGAAPDQPARGGRPPLRRRGARPRLGRGRPLRRLLGARPQRLGPGRGRAAGHRGRRPGHRRRWRTTTCWATGSVCAGNLDIQPQLLERLRQAGEIAPSVDQRPAPLQ